MLWTKKRLLKEYGIVRSLVPDDEDIYENNLAYGRCDDKRALFLPTAKRLVISQLGIFGGRKINDYGWGKFKHLKISEGWTSSTLELVYRAGNRSLKLEGLNKEQIRSFYRQARGRITKYDNRHKISSKICPECRETINFTARQCPYCHTEMKIEPEFV